MEKVEDIMDFLDCTGRKRKFQFEVREAGSLIRLEAKEIRSDRQPGYYFREIGTMDELILLRGKLNHRIMEGLSKRYLAPRKTKMERRKMLTDKLEGYLAYDNEVCLVVDGEKINWDEFKEFMEMHEGFFFCLEFKD